MKKMYHTLFFMNFQAGHNGDNFVHDFHNYDQGHNIIDIDIRFHFWIYPDMLTLDGVIDVSKRGA